MTGTELGMWRVTHNYTQRELAAELEISLRTLTNWEHQGPLPLSRYVELALKGLLFTHRSTCHCPQCSGNPDRYSEVARRVYDPHKKELS